MVEQRHREAAADLLTLRGEHTKAEIQEIRDGGHDNWETVQAFARFEAALSRPAMDREVLARIIDPSAWRDAGYSWAQWRIEQSLAKADAILALLPADVIICLARVPGIWESIEAKMAINRKRVWGLTGDGCGYHVPPAIRARGDVK